MTWLFCCRCSFCWSTWNMLASSPPLCQFVKFDTLGGNNRRNSVKCHSISCCTSACALFYTAIIHHSVEISDRLFYSLSWTGQTTKSRSAIAMCRHVLTLQGWVRTKWWRQTGEVDWCENICVLMKIYWCENIMCLDEDIFVWEYIYVSWWRY